MRFKRLKSGGIIIKFIVAIKNIFILVLPILIGGTAVYYIIQMQSEYSLVGLIKIIISLFVTIFQFLFMN